MRQTKRWVRWINGQQEETYEETNEQRNNLNYVNISFYCTSLLQRQTFKHIMCIVACSQYRIPRKYYLKIANLVTSHLNASYTQEGPVGQP